MRRYASLMALVAGHFIIDGYMGMVSPLLPIIRERLGLSLAQMGFIPVFTSIASSLAQPLFGWVCDRTRGTYLIVLGVAATGIGITNFGRADSFWPMMALLGLGGLGCGAFHPAGAALAAKVGRERRDLALAIFSPGGILGYSVGPVVAIALYQSRGLDNMWPAMLVGLFMAPIIGGFAARVEAGGEADAPDGDSSPVDHNGIAMPRRERLAKLAVLLVVVFLRSAVVIIFVAFLAQLLQDRGVAERWWGILTGAFTFGGGVAGLVGGTLARTVGRRRLTVASLAVAGPGLLASLYTHGWPSWALLILGGALAQAAVPANIVQAQVLLPSRQSLASALTMGFCWGTAAFLAPAFGYVADHTTLTFALTLACAIPPIAAVLALFVPELQPIEERLASAEPPPMPPPPMVVGEGG